ncbi:hypothetical protein CN613_25560 [Bacillus pseudomycoides]|uniref:Uncharacterized protein n=1 Tax=Bacillus pseudomycoides TaxID=64104 RepID=A0A2A8BYQ3_9BACI|nr:hypothetical protein [Bacillus pseudomycoides]PEM65314.1 hypothetical protein CN613_25560 [Bacillus pseudomycoides]
MKYNRGQLLQMAYEGKVKKDDQFKSNRGDIIFFDGHSLRWEDGGQMLRNRIFMNELFECYTPKVTVELTQKEVNTLRVLTGATSSGDLKEKNSRRGTLDIVTDGGYGLYSKFLALSK